MKTRIKIVQYPNRTEYIAQNRWCFIWWEIDRCNSIFLAEETIDWFLNLYPIATKYTKYP
jgi:hypothetical protein